MNWRDRTEGLGSKRSDTRMIGVDVFHELLATSVQFVLEGRKKIVRKLDNLPVIYSTKCATRIDHEAAIINSFDTGDL